MRDAMRPTLRKLVWIAPIALLALALCVLLGGELVKWLWNAILPGLFSFPRIGFWQALGLLALCRILFGGLGVRTRGGSGWRDRMEARQFLSMTPEERERFRVKMRMRWGLGRDSGTTGPDADGSASI